MGRHDVDTMLHEMTPEQLDEWIAYWQLEPWDTRLASAQISRHVHVAAQQIICAQLRAKWDKRFIGSAEDFVMTTRSRKKKRKPWNPFNGSS